MTAAIPARELQFSPLGGRVTQQGISVVVHIYRFADSPDDPWQLEVVDHEGGSTVWDETFPTDDDALAAFAQAVQEDGIGAFARLDAETKH
jgi:hypothetical protein